MRRLGVAVCFALVAFSANAQTGPQMMTLAGMVDCVKEATASGSVEHDGNVLIFSCAAAKAKTLYNFLGRKVRAEVVLVHVALDVLADDDRVVDHHADGEHQAEQGEQVDREAERHHARHAERERASGREARVGEPDRQHERPHGGGRNRSGRRQREALARRNGRRVYGRHHRYLARVRLRREGL